MDLCQSLKIQLLNPLYLSQMSKLKESSWDYLKHLFAQSKRGQGLIIQDYINIL